LEEVELWRRQISEIKTELAHVMKDHVAALRRLGQMPGIDLCAAQELLAQIGPRAAAFATADQFASWVGVRNRRS